LNFNPDSCLIEILTFARRTGRHAGGRARASSGLVFAFSAKVKYRICYRACVCPCVRRA